MWESAIQRAKNYCRRRNLDIVKELGWGQDGVVFSTNRRTTFKSFRHKPQYKTERAVYQRLHEHGVTKAAGFTVPDLIDIHDELLVIEMLVVQPPYVIDFSSPYLEEPPDFPEDLMAEEYERRRELFGDNWPRVASLMSEFRAIGIYLADVNPRNIAVE